MAPIGILGKLDDIDDETARFYAYIGLSVSQAASIEAMLFHCYYIASRQTHAAAAAEFYRDVRFQRKRELAVSAVSKLIGGPDREWDSIANDIERLCGPDGVRNLVSHNELGWDLYAQKGDTSMPPLLELTVRQNRGAIAAGKREERAEDLKSVRAYAGDLVGLYFRLESFYQKQLAHRIRH